MNYLTLWQVCNDEMVKWCIKLCKNRKIYALQEAIKNYDSVGQLTNQYVIKVERWDNDLPSTKEKLHEACTIIKTRVTTTITTSNNKNRLSSQSQIVYSV